MRAVNLIPADQRPGGASIAGRSGGVAYVIVGLLIVLAGLTALYASAHHEVASREAEATRLSAEASQAEQAASALAPYSSFVTLREERVGDVKQLAGTRFDWAHVMHELGRVLPASSVSLSTVTGAIGAAAETLAPTTETTTPAPTSSTAVGGSVTSSTPAGSTPVLTIAGCARSQATVALTMDRLRLMNGVSEVSLQSSQESGSATGASSSGACGERGPTFALTVDFEDLPTPQTAPTSASTSASDSSSSGSSGESASSSSSSSSEGALR